MTTTDEDLPTPTGAPWTTEPGAIVFFDYPQRTLTIEEAYELMHRVSTEESDSALAQLGLVAAAEVHTGAMIAFIPSTEDVIELVQPDGEPLEQLHITSIFLGEAADWDDDDREAVHTAIADLVQRQPVIEAEIFGFAIWNPTAEVCLVASVSGADIEDAQASVEEWVEDLELEVPDQHYPWIPHMTLAYGPTQIPPELLEKVGPITIDRIRVTFGGVVTDYPLGGGMQAASAPHVFHLPGKHDQKSHGHGGGEAMHIGSKKELKKARADYDERLAGARTGGEAMGSVPLGQAWKDDDKTVGGVNNGEVSAALDTYAGSTGYYDVNEGLRRAHGDPSKVVKPPPNPNANPNLPPSKLETTADVRATIDTMDMGMGASRTESDIVVHRMIADPGASYQFGTAYKRNGDNTGLSWRDHAYTSTSAVGEEGTLAFQGMRLRGGFDSPADRETMVMRIVIPKGHPALLGKSGLEGEIILPHDTSFRIIRDHGSVSPEGRTSSGTRFVDVELFSD